MAGNAVFKSASRSNHPAVSVRPDVPSADDTPRTAVTGRLRPSRVPVRAVLPGPGRPGNTSTSAEPGGSRPSTVPARPFPGATGSGLLWAASLPQEANAGQQARRVLSSPGRPLRPDLRASIGEAFNTDLSAVRIHEGPEAAASARAVGASVYASGPHIVVGDHADIESLGARRTLAHELFHVKQQSEGPVSGVVTGDGLAVSDPSDPYERAARRAAEHITGAHGLWAPPVNLRAEITHVQAGSAQGPAAVPVQRDTFNVNTSYGGIHAERDINIGDANLSGQFTNCQISVSGGFNGQFTNTQVSAVGGAELPTQDVNSPGPHAKRPRPPDAT
jgi:Domain of unknown function (DUF4157)